MAMDGLKHRSSLDDPRQALRRLAHSPRLSLRRPASTTSSSSSASSIASHDTHEEIQCCVGRDVPNDDCAHNRFIVWAAVKRNACQKMTPEERRECPLLRCRKRFDDHEQMLKHLHTCDELSAGEYWCYECTRVERFAEAKPKKCPSHPSKRKKAMIKARNFFSSLGNRSKNDGLIDLETIEETYPQFNYEDDHSFTLPVPSPVQAELQSNEIHEIDSTPLPMIMEDESEGLDDTPPMLTMTVQQPPTLATYSLPISPPTIHPTELECGNRSSAVVAGCIPSIQPPTIVPANLINHDDDKSPLRPSLQLHTTGLEQYRKNVKAAKASRSKYLGPSSSVRSTASTDSTNSTNSTSTTASYAISPVSAWSGAWVRGHEFESTLTSPADEFAACDPFGSIQEPLDTFECHFDDQFGVQFDGDLATDSFAVQPSTDLPMSDILTNSDHTVTPVDLFQTPLYPFDTAGISDLSFENKADDTVPTIHIHEPMSQLDLLPELYGDMTADGGKNGAGGLHKDLRPRRSDSSRKERRRKAVALIRNAFQALQLHVAESLSRIEHIKNSPLVDTLRQTPPESVLAVGLDALTRILSGSIVTSPSDLICFVHLAYSFSVMMNEEDAMMRDTKPFSQAVAYASWLTQEDRKSYLAMVNLLWKPNTMSDDVVLGLMRSASKASRSRYTEASKLIDQSYIVINDSLAGAAQLFLDELEHTLMLRLAESGGQASDLYEHWNGSNVALYSGSPFHDVANHLHQMLLHQYPRNPEFTNGLRQLFCRAKEGCVSTLRQFELDLLHVGKTTLSSEVFAETYAPFVRIQMDDISTRTGIQRTPRSVYYQHGIRLIRSVVAETSKGSKQKEAQTRPAPDLKVVGDVLKSMMSQATGQDFSPVSAQDLSSPYGFEGDAYGNSMATTVDTCTTTTVNTECTTAATTPPSPGPTHLNPGTPGIKMESDSCCELCGYRPEGDPRWFSGSMAKHKKLQHATSPPKIYSCPYPGCTSQYRNRPDNLRQHQLKKGHFVEGHEEAAPRPPKRKKMDS